MIAKLPLHTCLSQLLLYAYWLLWGSDGLHPCRDAVHLDHIQLTAIVRSQTIIISGAIQVMPSLLAVAMQMAQSPSQLQHTLQPRLPWQMWKC